MTTNTIPIILMIKGMIDQDHQHHQDHQDHAIDHAINHAIDHAIDHVTTTVPPLPTIQIQTLIIIRRTIQITNTTPTPTTTTDDTIHRPTNPPTILRIQTK